MSLTPAQILPTIAPELVGDQSAVIAIAEMQIAPGLCGDKRPLLVAYLAAHIATLAARGGVSGGVSAMTEGSLSVSFGGSMKDGLGATAYGQEYDRLSRACVFAAGTRASYGG
jgi:hypothetical protein